MKRTIATIATAVLMTLSFSSFANSNSNPLKEKDAKEILLTYVEATAVGTIDYNKFLFADDFEYTNTTTEEKFSKKQYLSFLKENKGLQYNCKSNYEILDRTGNTAVAKSTMKFDNFTRVDHITLTNSKDGWKVSKVVTSYK